MSTQVVLASRGSPWRRLYASNVAQASAVFTTDGLQGRSRGPRPNENLYSDSNDLKVLDLRGDAGPGGETPNAIEFVPFGSDTTNQTMNVRVWGIEQGVGLVGSTDTPSWEPKLLAQFQATLSASKAGASGSLVTASDYYADTITLTYGATADVAILTNAADIRMASIRVFLSGYQIIVVEIDANSSAATVNSLYRLLW